MCSLPLRQDICKPDISLLRSKLQKPLRPLWVTQNSSLPHDIPDFPDFHPVILCTASRRVRGAEASEGGYIQGAADDHEAWSHGLTPPLFWSNKDELLRTNEKDLQTKIAELVSQDRGTDAVSTLIRPTNTLYVSASQNIDLTLFDTVVSCTPEPLPQTLLKNAGVKAYLHLSCQTGKLGSRDLRNQLPALHHLPTSSHPTNTDAPPKTLICCPTGKDLSVGTALAYLCLYVSDNGTVTLQKARESRDIDKTFIKQRLSWITTSNPALNPSRATLQSVNSVLMSSTAAPSTLPEWQDPALHDQDWNPLPAPPTSALSALALHSTASPDPTKAPDSENEMLAPHADPPSLPHTIFAALASSSWSFTRSLRSSLPTYPSGTVVGIASFTPAPLSNTLLYAEEGMFTTDTGLVFTARRKYVYQLITTSSSSSTSSSAVEEGGEGDEQFIRVRFFDDTVRRDDIGSRGEGVGGLFVEMGELRDGADGIVEARNREQHLCGEDLYGASWRFARSMVDGKRATDGKERDREGKWWEVRYDVKGPKKDYVSTTRYSLEDDSV